MNSRTSSSDGSARLAEQRDGRHDLAGSAVAALVGVLLEKGRLHRVQPSGRAEPFDGDDLVAALHRCQRQAGVRAPAVDVDGAGAALAVVAALLGPGEMERLAQAIEQGHARVDAHLSLLSVHSQVERQPFVVSIDACGGAGLQACHGKVLPRWRRRR